MTEHAETSEDRSKHDAEMVTVCAWTKKVRFDGEWVGVESYLKRRYGVLTSHGMSPDAVELIDGELASAQGPTRGGAEHSERGQPAALTSPRRLAALRATGLLDSPEINSFDRLTRIGAQLLDVQTTFISLVDDHRDFYLSHCGFGEPLASSRQLTGQTFCHFTIEGEGPLVIPDTRADPLYRNVPTVESLGVAAYLGAPLVLLSGEVIGAFCAVDTVPRAWTDAQIRNARDIASIVLSEIELRQMVMITRNAPQ